MTKLPCNYLRGKVRCNNPLNENHMYLSLLNKASTLAKRINLSQRGRLLHKGMASPCITGLNQVACLGNNLSRCKIVSLGLKLSNLYLCCNLTRSNQKTPLQTPSERFYNNSIKDKCKASEIRIISKKIITAL